MSENHQYKEADENENIQYTVFATASGAWRQAQEVTRTF
jgi:hypothetical protein